jgi:hypothetical protein
LSVSCYFKHKLHSVSSTIMRVVIMMNAFMPSVAMLNVNRLSFVILNVCVSLC